MSTVARGNAAELLCIHTLEDEGWICVSTREREARAARIIQLRRQAARMP